MKSEVKGQLIYAGNGMCLVGELIDSSTTKDVCLLSCGSCLPAASVCEVPVQVTNFQFFLFRLYSIHTHIPIGE